MGTWSDSMPLTRRATSSSQDRLKLHTLGTSWPAQWITIHNTATNGTAPFDANALAKAAGATPFERPENLQFRPGPGSARSSSRRPATRTPTPATSPSSRSEGPGAACSRSTSPTARAATSRSWPWATRCTRRSTTWRSPTATRSSPPRTAGTDCTRSEHARLAVGVQHDRSGAPGAVHREGRDPAAQADAALLDAGTPGFQNEGDNEVTGVHVAVRARRSSPECRDARARSRTALVLHPAAREEPGLGDPAGSLLRAARAYGPSCVCSSGHSRVFTTSAAVAQPRRAVATP